ncbi:MAG: tetratricopeptide repeat protein [Sphingobacteriales bacterium]|nr:tetratricopeptide repeat protein [Sphingobacteriales bacterium]
MTKRLTCYCLLVLLPYIDIGAQSGGLNPPTANSPDPTATISAEQAQERDIYYKKALAKFLAQDYSVARAYITIALETDPNYAPAYATLAEIELGLGNIDEALIAAEQAVKTDPTLVTAYIARGKGALKQENPKKALKDAEKALTLAPDNADAKQLLADASEKAKTLSAENETTKDDKGSDKKQTALQRQAEEQGMLPAAIAKANKQQYDAALKDFGEIISLDPNFKTVLPTRTYVYARRQTYRGISRFITGYFARRTIRRCL